MYTSNNGNKSKGRTKLTEMGVVVIDDETDSTNKKHEKTESEQPAQQNREKSLLNEDDAPLDVSQVNTKEKRSRFKRVLIASSVSLSLLFIIFCLGYFWLSRSRSETDAYKVKAPAASNKADELPRGITAEEISAELNKHKTDSNTPSDETLSNQTESPASSSPITNRLPNEDLSATVKADESHDTQTSVASSSTSRNSGATTTSSIQENNSSLSRVSPENNSLFVPTRSIRVSTLKPDKAEENKQTSEQQPINESKLILSETITTRKISSVSLPPFGAMLPVRTVGTIFTLRSDSYVRFELARDISGQGWSLKRGTQFYGITRSADIETARAFISISGFIDPKTNRFVRLQGSVMGTDGADGVKGKKHKLNSGWVNALKKVGREVLDTAKSAATGIGRRPIIISETSPRVVDPIAEELSGLSLNRDGFIEVAAGTACYLLVMTQPAEIQGVDADISSFNASQSSGQNGLSEQELAELLTHGNKDEIRRALPLMTPQMRLLAEIFLSNK